MWILEMRAHRALIPREHGATTQLVLVIASAAAVSSASASLLLLAAAATALFVAHEPLMVSLGKLGARRREARGRDAAIFLPALAGIALVAGVLGLGASPTRATLLALLPCVALATAALGSALRGPERTLGVELLAALAMAWLAAPLALAGGAPASLALSLALLWSGVFALGTLAARSILISKRDGGRGVRWARAASLLAVAGCSAALVVDISPAWVPAALLPTALMVMLLTLLAPRPAQMTRTGLLLATAAAAALPALP